MSLPKTHPIYALPSVSIRAQLWDIAGQERYTSLTRAYYRNAVAAVVVGDLESPTFYEDVLGWKKDIDEKVKLMDTDVPIPCILCCNKIDSEAANAWYAKNGEAVAKFARENRFAGMYDKCADRRKSAMRLPASLCGNSCGAAGDTASSNPIYESGCSIYGAIQGEVRK